MTAGQAEFLRVARILAVGLAAQPEVAALARTWTVRYPALLGVVAAVEVAWHVLLALKKTPAALPPAATPGPGSA